MLGRDGLKQSVTRIDVENPKPEALNPCEDSTGCCRSAIASAESLRSTEVSYAQPTGPQ